MPSDPETEALRQRLDALVKDADAPKAKAAAARRRVQATCQLLEEEHVTAADLERKAAATKDLNQRFEHLRAIIQRSPPFPNFFKVCDPSGDPPGHRWAVRYSYDALHQHCTSDS
jgi:hypothetical protein